MSLRDRHGPWRERLDLGRRRHFRKDEAIGVIGEARRKQRDADAGHMLRQAERHDEHRMQEAEGRAGQCRDDHARTTDRRPDRR